MTPGYVMGWCAELDQARVEAYNAGQMDVDDVVLFFQDLLEAGMMPPQRLAHVSQMVLNGLIHITGRKLQ